MKTNDPAYSEYKSRLIRSIHDDIETLAKVRSQCRNEHFCIACSHLSSAANLLSVFNEVTKEDWYEEEFVVAKRTLLGEVCIHLADAYDNLNIFVGTIERYDFDYTQYNASLDSIVKSCQCLLDNYPIPMNIKPMQQNSRLAEIAKNINFDDLKNLANDPASKRIVYSKDGQISRLRPDFSPEHKSPVKRVIQRIIDFMPYSEARRKEKEYWEKSPVTKQEMKALTKAVTALSHMDKTSTDDFLKLSWHWGTVTATYREIEKLVGLLEGIQKAITEVRDCQTLVSQYDIEYNEAIRDKSTQRILQKTDSSIKLLYDNNLLLVDEIELTLHDVKFVLATIFDKQYAVYTATNDLPAFIGELQSQRITYAQLYEFFLYMRMRKYFEEEKEKLPEKAEIPDVNLVLTPNVQIKNNLAQVIDNEPGGIVVPQISEQLLMSIEENRKPQLPNK